MRGEQRSKAKRYREALRDFEAALEYPDNLEEGLAFRKLGREREAAEIFDGLTRIGKDRLPASPPLDFFAKFGEKQSELIRIVHAHYLSGLGYLGKGDKEGAKAEFEQVLELNPNHTGAIARLSELKL